ncbi:expressed unknown protein [Ectocarpus siliculosus]|uniref:Uncharacterized protein n=1 Tax=Ectocarpus siliculosus TaxID=2880 RepID=D8LSV1_ECTSI|nr:expressed unknown protein [Ectocarpus siliculosus]|eukprot:CBN77878.1 expressed unknown protein [Ectocarpus siliculosus]
MDRINVGAARRPAAQHRHRMAKLPARRPSSARSTASRVWSTLTRGAAIEGVASVRVSAWTAAGMASATGTLSEEWCINLVAKQRSQLVI